MIVNRPGRVVVVAGALYQLLDRAAPSGWWASPVRGGAPIRILGGDKGWRLPKGCPR